MDVDIDRDILGHARRGTRRTSTPGVESLHFAPMSLKRAAGSTPAASKQPRVSDVDRVTPATAVRPHGRVVLNVGGQHFESSRSTLEGSSSYFSALLARWDEDQEIFIDCDADAFGVLLSHMRIASNLILPDDHKLCARVLLLAEYLGMEDLLAMVKVKAYKNMHPGGEVLAASDAVAAFDAEVGSLQSAIDDSVLPARFFAPAPKPPERVVKTLIPAPPGYTAMFTNGAFEEGKPRDEYGNMALHTYRDVLSFALVELPDGSTLVDAVVQQSLESEENGYNAYDVLKHEDTNRLQNHLQFASEVRI